MVVANSIAAYALAYQTFWIYILLACPGSYLINAPFGRFSVEKSCALPLAEAPSQLWTRSVLSFNANISWFLMEVVSPLSFSVCLFGKPLDVAALNWSQFSLQEAYARWYTFSSPTKLLAALYLVHYLNRSTLGPLRMPAKRAPMHLVVVLASVVFNILNGSLMGTWLGGRTLSTSIGNTGAVPSDAFASNVFWVGVVLWLLGFTGNIYHDKILNDLRRPAKDGKQPPRYSIPHGGLYSFPFGGVTLPSYFCEWVEWTGFAIAATSLAPPPALPLLGASDTTFHASLTTFVEAAKIILVQLIKLVTPFVPAAAQLIKADPSHPLLSSATYLTPPWVFLWAEIAVMVPRAVKSHHWYQQKFGADFPKERKIVVPGLL